MIRYLLDEHVSPSIRQQLIRKSPDLVVWIIGDPDAPPKGASDPDLLTWCEEHEFFLITNNRKTMPSHLADHLTNGHHMPGILVVDPSRDIGQLLDELVLIAYASFENEYRDRIVYLPLEFW
ncbi:MAG: DUF5615 family PIN-like protein [Fimbriimonadia bacterium]|nr:DUF5615 family PIN-like protein [Fimbriimonadia bacterium]